MVFRLGNWACWVRFVAVAFVGLVVSWSSLLAQSQSVGTWQLVGADYYDVACHGDTVLFVGQYGGVLRSTDGGNRWTLPYSGTYYDLLGVGFFRDGIAVAIGLGGTVLRSVDAGATWERVAVIDSGYLGYRSMSLLPSGVGYIVTGSGDVLRSVDAGITWGRVTAVPSGVFLGHLVKFLNASTGVVVADSGRIYRTSDSGSTWNLVYTDTSSAFPGAVAFADTLNGVVCRRDDRTVLRTTDGGMTWWSVPSPAPGVFPWSVVMPDTSTILLVGEIDPSVTQGYTVARSVDGGQTWSTGWPSGLLTAYYVRFSGVVAESGHIYVSGSLGVALGSGDLGESWDVLSSAQLDLPIYGQATLRGIAFADDTVGVIPTDFLSVGEMLRTTNGGVTWVSGATRKLGVIDPHFFTSTYGIAGWSYRGSYFETTDAGKTWMWADCEDSPEYFETWSVEWYDRDLGFKAGDSLVYRTTDGGKTWEGNAVPESYVVRKLEVVSPSTVYCLAGLNSHAKLYRSVDSGRTWDLVLQRRQSDYLIGLTFLDDTTGFVAAQTGRVYRTVDGGKTWDSVLFEGMVPKDVRFFSRDNGMVVGANAIVYVTNDGGETWQPDWSRPDGPELPRVDLERIALLPDRRTVIVTGYGCIARKVFPGALSGVNDPFEPEPERSSLMAVSPNPFDGGELTVRLDPSVTGKGLNVSLFDVLGRKVRDVTRYVRYDQAGGVVQVSREGLASGVYVVVLQANGRVSSRSVVVR